jgi:hypothetical protein
MNSNVNSSNSIQILRSTFLAEYKTTVRHLNILKLRSFRNEKKMEKKTPNIAIFGQTKRIF